jgi:hypothetical protein
MLRVLLAWPRLAMFALVAIGSLASCVLIAFLVELQQRAWIVFEHRWVSGAEAVAQDHGWSADSKGVVWLAEEQLHFVTPDGTLRALPVPGELDGATSQSQSGEVTIGTFKQVNTDSLKLHLVRLDTNGRVRFDVELEESRSLWCDPGYFPPAVSTHGTISWVAVYGRVLGFDADGRLLVDVSACAREGPEPDGDEPRRGCASHGLWARSGGVVASARGGNRDHSELVWLTNDGRVEARTTTNVWPDAFDGEETFYALARPEHMPCADQPDDDLLRIARIDREGCSLGPSIPRELFSGDSWLPTAATKQHVYIASHAASSPRWAQWLRGRSRQGISIHRFTTDGKYLDSRWAPQPHSTQPLTFVQRGFTVLEGGRALLSLAEGRTGPTVAYPSAQLSGSSTPPELTLLNPRASVTLMGFDY